jgi:hypothetical protein
MKESHNAMLAKGSPMIEQTVNKHQAGDHQKSVSNTFHNRNAWRAIVSFVKRCALGMWLEYVVFREQRGTLFL